MSKHGVIDMSYEGLFAILVRRAFVVLALAMVFASGVLAETVPIGIRFILSDDLGLDAMHQAAVSRSERMSTK